MRTRPIPIPNTTRDLAFLGAFALVLAAGTACRTPPAQAGSDVRPAGTTATGPTMTQDPRPTLLLVNARIWTGDTARPWAEAMAVGGERILTVGTTAEVRAVATKLAAAGAPARELDAGGRLVVPGLIDSHVHFLDGGFNLMSVQLRDAKTRDEFVRRIGEFAKSLPEGTWITGGDWDQTLWGGPLPDRQWIDAVTPKHPVLLQRLDGHMAIANTAAIDAAGIGNDVKDVEGGAIDRDARGRITGIVRDNAMALVARAIPPPSPEASDRALDAAMHYVAERGVTSVHNMGSWNDLEVFERAHHANRLTTRIYAAVPLDSWERLRDRVAKGGVGADVRGDEWLRIGALKGFVDGSLGSHTAAFFEPFTDSPDSGLFVNPPESLYTWISGADRAGLHVSVHAIGDRANRTLLDIYERVARENGPRDRRFRIEHAQHLAPADLPRFGALGVVASMQPYHAIDDGRWAEKVIGPERIKGTYAFRALIDTKAHVAFGSDWFVAPPTPLEGIYAAVTRRTLDGANPGGWVPAQKISVEEALRLYTREAAYASFAENEKGVLAPGMLADFVALERNLFEMRPEEINTVRVAMTVVGGKVVYQR